MRIEKSIMFGDYIAKQGRRITRGSTAIDAINKLLKVICKKRSQ